MKSNTNLHIYNLSGIPHYRVHGRTDKSQPALPLFWNGSGMEVNVTGTELWIDIDVDYDVYEPWAACFIDGAFISRQMLTPGSYSLCLFRGMSRDVVKNVKFIRELQPMTDDEASHLLVRGLRTDGEFLPVADSRYKLEFIGDSITSGEGTYGAKGDQPWIPMFMSASRHYAAMTSQALGAEYRLLSQGGWGTLCGWDNNPQHALPLYYEQICGLAAGSVNEALGALKPNPFDEWQPDAIIVNLGTNDCSAFHQPAWVNPITGETFKQHGRGKSFNEKDLARFEKAVTDFLTLLRSHNEKAHIVWVYGMLGYNLTLPLTEAISTYKRESGDRKIGFLQLPTTTKKTEGARFHPGVQVHEQAAAILTEYLKDLLKNG